MGCSSANSVSKDVSANNNFLMDDNILNDSNDVGDNVLHDANILPVGHISELSQQASETANCSDKDPISSSKGIPESARESNDNASQQVRITLLWVLILLKIK